MPYVVTQPCVGDGSCVIACPVNCIHPAPGEPGFAEAEMLFVDPAACVDCGACTTACPVDAIQPHTALTRTQLPFVALNASYFVETPHLERSTLAPLPRTRVLRAERPVRVAIVGAGPAGLYAADSLLAHPGVTVDLYDRLPTPHGLVRAGVAPDHRHTKRMSRLFETIEDQPGFSYLLNVEVGHHVTHQDLERHYHGVIYAVGASQDRVLGIVGEELPGSQSATSFVGWYNGHPDHAHDGVDLATERVVVVGNGNVALDVARILTSCSETLVTTDMPAGPLEALRRSSVEEVVVLGRRGPEHAAFTLPELVGLAGLEDVDVLVDNGGEAIDATSAKTALLAEIARRTPRPGHRRIVLRFHTAPVQILGDRAVTGIEVALTSPRTDRDGVVRADSARQVETLATGLVLRSVGSRVDPVPGLPFDQATGRVPHDRGRVAPGTYVTGWVKRGPSGFIGTNKRCAEETVDQLLGDLESGALVPPTGTPRQMRELVRAAQPETVGLAGWRAIDRAEVERGLAGGRARVKVTDVQELVELGADASRRSGRRRR